MQKILMLFLITIVGFASIDAEENKPFIVADLYGQLGNNLFQVATGSALAWDNDAEAYFPGLSLLPTLYNHIFSRCKVYPPSNDFSFHWTEPGLYKYASIPFQPNMHINGYFQTEKYFAHHRDRLLDLLAPSSKDLRYIKKKYDWLLNHPETVGVQLRYYVEDKNGEIFIQYGQDYLEKAMSLFPETTLFVISSNNMDFARENVPSSIKNVIFLEEPFYIDFYLLSFCKHNIITNSTFGWWSAWLNQNPDQKVVCPRVWVNGFSTEHVCPDSWLKIDAKRGRSGDPKSY